MRKLVPLTKRAIQFDGRENDRKVIATYGDKAILQTGNGNREEWKLTDRNGHFVMYCDGAFYEFSKPLYPHAETALP